MPSSTSPEDILITPAEAAEVEELSYLAQQSKAHWGYPAEWLEEWRPQLTITVETLERETVFVARRAGRPVGFYSIAFQGDVASLEHLWVEPSSMGSGVGRLLLRHAKREAERRGYRRLQIDSDPYAEAFYLRMGAVRVGMVEAPVAGTPRELPRLELDVARRDD